MNHTTALDQLETDLEVSLNELKKEKAFWAAQENCENFILKYEQLIRFYNEALNGVRNLKAKLLQIDRGF